MKYQFKQQKMSMHTKGSLLILALSCVAVGGLLVYGPIPQDPVYHEFADQRTMFAIPNFWNVVSNLPLVIIGLIGMNRCKTHRNYSVGTENTMASILLFTGILFTGLCSAYYHIQPENWGLFWDRLPMALSFMAFLSIVIAEFVSRKLGKHLLLPLVLFGMGSVLYWIVTEQFGIGDLRPYVLTQFLPMLVILLIIMFWKSESIKPSDMLIIGAGYALAKLFEALDTQLYQITDLSGHTLKHLTAALSACWMIVIMNRKPRNTTLDQ